MRSRWLHKTLDKLRGTKNKKEKRDAKIATVVLRCLFYELLDPFSWHH